MENCPICLEELGNTFKVTPCIHHFHIECLEKWENSGTIGRRHCPVCRTRLDDNQINDNSDANIVGHGTLESLQPLEFNIIEHNSESSNTYFQIIEELVVPPLEPDTPPRTITIISPPSPPSPPRSNRLMAHYSYCARCEESTLAYEVCHGSGESCRARSSATCRRNHPMVHRVVPYGSEPRQRDEACFIM